jgi:hypothetical protein
VLGIRIRILPFSHKGVERTEKMLENKILTQSDKTLEKIKFLRLKKMNLQQVIRKKI